MFFCVVLCVIKTFTLDSMSMYESHEHFLYLQYDLIAFCANEDQQKTI